MALPAVLFLAVWALLDVTVNLRYPGTVHEPPFWYLLPAVDVTVLLAVFALCAHFRRRVPPPVTLALAAGFLLVRLFRVADGLIQQNYYRSVNLAVDLPLLPELVRLLAATVPPPRFFLGALAVTVALTGALALLFVSLRYSQTYLARGPGERRFFFALAAAFVLAGPAWPRIQPTGHLHRGLFGRSVVPVAVDQIALGLSARTIEQTKRAELRAASERLAQLPSDLGELRGGDVLLFLIESYGHTVLTHPELRAAVGPRLAAFGAALTGAGYATASTLLDSPVYGGHSWLAHATLATGARITNAVEYALARHLHPPPLTMATLFKRAGFRTVLVQPATTRPWPEGLVAGFDHRHYAWSFGYTGPAFAWATMPDEYVIDVVHRKEIAPARGPLFIEYALISSHSPWAVTPPFIGDPARLAQGAVYHQTPAHTFPVGWGNLSRARPAYAHAIRYDLDVLERYLTTQLERDALIIIMGDHQPAGPVTGHDPDHAVPVHLASRNHALVARFAAAGFTPGILPAPRAHNPGIETLVVTLAERLSHDRPVTSQSRPPAHPVR